MSFAIDPHTARHTWVQGFLFPGIISLAIILYSCFPTLFEIYVPRLLDLEIGLEAVKPLILFMYLWLAFSMLAAWITKLLEKTRVGRITPALMYLIGFGPLLCAVTFASYILELRGAEMKWDKTVKTGKANILK